MTRAKLTAGERRCITKALKVVSIQRWMLQQGKTTHECRVLDTFITLNSTISNNRYVIVECGTYVPVEVYRSVRRTALCCLALYKYVTTYATHQEAGAAMSSVKGKGFFTILTVKEAITGRMGELVRILKEG